MPKRLYNAILESPHLSEFFRPKNPPPPSSLIAMAEFMANILELQPHLSRLVSHKRRATGFSEPQPKEIKIGSFNQSMINIPLLVNATISRMALPPALLPLICELLRLWTTHWPAAITHHATLPTAIVLALNMLLPFHQIDRVPAARSLQHLIKTPSPDELKFREEVVAWLKYLANEAKSPPTLRVSGSSSNSNDLDFDYSIFDQSSSVHTLEKIYAIERCLFPPSISIARTMDTKAVRAMIHFWDKTMLTRFAPVEDFEQYFMPISASSSSLSEQTPKLEEFSDHRGSHASQVFSHLFASLENLKPDDELPFERVIDYSPNTDGYLHHFYFLCLKTIADATHSTASTLHSHACTAAHWLLKITRQNETRASSYPSAAS
jgi:hypothetical protein